VKLNKIADNARDALCKKCRKLFKKVFGIDMTKVPENWWQSQPWLTGVWEKMNLKPRMMPTMQKVITDMLEKKRGKAIDRWPGSPAAAAAAQEGDLQYHLYPSPRKRSPKKGAEKRKKRKSAAPVQIPVVISEGQRGAPAGEAAGGQVPPQGDAAN